ncbi:MAG: hypothetical protein ABMB14_12005 [Myxococcota bacterium]
MGGVVSDTLRAFAPSTLVVRAVDAVLAATPGASAIAQYGLVDDVVAAIAPGASDDVRARAHTLVDDPVAARILAVGTAIDGADRDLPRAIRRGGDGLALQAEDAALKALGLGWFARMVGVGEPAARAEALRSLPSGRALIAVWAAVDVALPLQGADVARLVADRGPAQGARLVSLAGEDAMDGVTTVLGGLGPVLQQAVDIAAGRIAALAEALAPFVPGLIATAEGAAEQIAVQSDRLPMYKWLAARLAAEHAVLRAVAAG